MNSSSTITLNALRPINRLHLKLIAFITMTIDHIGLTFFPATLWFRYVGRIAFPLFAIGIAEGVAKTKNHRKYLFRLTILAFISEIPFHLMLDNRPFFIDFNILPYVDAQYIFSIIQTNVVFTLLAGACICVLIGKKNLHIFEYILYTAVPIGVFYLNSDYGIYGICLVVISYLTMKNNDFISGPIVGIVVTSLWMGDAQTWAIMAVVPVLLYNGKSARFASEKSSKIFSFVVYIYYPLHQLIIWLVSYLFPNMKVYHNIFS